MTDVAAALHHPAGSLAEGDWSTVLTPEAAGWRFSGVRAATLSTGGHISFDTAADEMIVLPLAGSFDVEVDGASYRLAGRTSVWAGPSDFVYAPPGASLDVSSVDGGHIAVATARTDGERRFPVRYVAADDVAVELRGGGACSREVRNFGAAHRFEADRVIAVEVLTPGGNWGSYPPHKHDEVRVDETELEEIYHYVVADGPSGPGLAYQHIYGTPARPIDLLTTVATGDTVLVPHGWHGPAMAAPGYDLYYLNVMAGPGERAWRACDDPAHAWVREAWVGQGIDPRLPFREGATR
ncbi:MAG TPA: 5-deoxy-glucuronate isomerase [Candidatus Limnocylindrales bacterium]|nr:5-deoxy-glucuronate isomerase [Candidatus Limnocylindrales bacterium]